METFAKRAQLESPLEVAHPLARRALLGPTLRWTEHHFALPVREEHLAKRQERQMALRLVWLALPVNMAHPLVRVVRILDAPFAQQDVLHLLLEVQVQMYASPVEKISFQLFQDPRCAHHVQQQR